MAHGAPGGLPVHGDGVELHRLQHTEHLLFSAWVTITIQVICIDPPPFAGSS
jgi:hypothetical protein